MRPTRFALPSLTSMTSGLSPRVSSSLDLLLLFPDAQFVVAPRIRCPLVDSPPADAAFPGKAADDTRHSLWPRSQPRRKPRGQRGWTDRPTDALPGLSGGTNPVFRSALLSPLLSLFLRRRQLTPSPIDGQEKRLRCAIILCEAIIYQCFYTFLFFASIFCCTESHI